MKGELFAISVALSAAALPAYAGDNSIRDLHWVAPGFRTDAPKAGAAPSQKSGGIPDTKWTAPGFRGDDTVPTKESTRPSNVRPVPSADTDDDTMSAFRHVFDNKNASPKCEQETDLSKLKPGVWEICYQGRKSIGSVINSSTGNSRMDALMRADMATMRAEANLIASKCKSDSNGSMRATTPVGVYRFAQGDKAYAIVPQAGYNEIQCR